MALQLGKSPGHCTKALSSCVQKNLPSGLNAFSFVCVEKVQKQKQNEVNQTPKQTKQPTTKIRSTCGNL